MAVVFDAYPLAAILLGEDAGIESADLLRASLRQASVCAVNLAEVVDVVSRGRRVEIARVVEAVQLWIDDGLRVVELDWATGRRAADVRAAHYHRTTSPLSMADCCAIATAERLQASLATSDEPMARAARALGIEVHALADSTGRRPGG